MTGLFLWRLKSLTFTQSACFHTPKSFAGPMECKCGIWRSLCCYARPAQMVGENQQASGHSRAQAIPSGRMSVLQKGRNLCKAASFGSAGWTEAAPWAGRQSPGCVFSDAWTHCISTCFLSLRYLFVNINKNQAATHKIAQAAFKLAAILSQPPKSCRDSYEPPCLAQMMIFLLKTDVHIPLKIQLISKHVYMKVSIFLVYFSSDYSLN